MNGQSRRGELPAQLYDNRAMADHAIWIQNAVTKYCEGGLAECARHPIRQLRGTWYFTPVYPNGIQANPPASPITHLKHLYTRDSASLHRDRHVTPGNSGGNLEFSRMSKLYRLGPGSSTILKPDFGWASARRSATSGTRRAYTYRPSVSI